jgi:putative endonuclease
MPWMYILTCSDGSYYVGSTTDLRARVGEHWTGVGSRYVAHRLPARVAFTCEFGTIQEAYDCERQVKGWSRAKKEAIIRGEFELLPGLAKNRQSSVAMLPSTGSGNEGPAL